MTVSPHKQTKIELFVMMSVPLLVVLICCRWINSNYRKQPENSTKLHSAVFAGGLGHRLRD